MDYTALVDAINSGDKKSVNEICADSLVILKKYLVANYGATPHDAEDAVQQMFEYLIPKIQENGIEKPGGLAKYMMKATKHSYLNHLRDFEFDGMDRMTEEPKVDGSQIWNLIDEDRKSILRKCIETLKLHYRALAEYILQHPEAEAEDVADNFEISVANAWTRKHRVIKQLSDCAEKNG
jgi:DNA-directed RNA polymerase specialized sigma24 family protein